MTAAEVEALLEALPPVETVEPPAADETRCRVCGATVQLGRDGEPVYHHLPRVWGGDRCPGRGADLARHPSGWRYAPADIPAYLPPRSS